MNVRIQKIDTELARHFSGFILPTVAEDPDFDQFTFFAAISGDTLCGILVFDIKEFEPEILSIGVSTEYENRGIAKKLLAYALSDLFSCFDVDAMEELPNQVSARVVEHVGALGKMEHLLTGAGFEPVEKGQFYQVSMKDVRNNQYLQNPKVLSKLNKPGDHLRFLSLKDTPHSLVNAFSNRLIAQDSFPGIEMDELDEDLTVFGIRDNSIEMCILFLKENQGVLQNNFMYLADTAGMGNAALMYMASFAANAAVQKLSDDISLNFWISSDTTKKLIDYIFPEAVCAQEAAFYELPLKKLKHIHDLRFTADLEFNRIENDQLTCANCKHCIENMVTECEKYLQKPDPVFEGGDCELFEAGIE